MWIRGKSDHCLYAPPNLLHLLGKLNIWGTICAECRCQGYWNFYTQFLTYERAIYF